MVAQCIRKERLRLLVRLYEEYYSLGRRIDKLEKDISEDEED